MDTAVLGCGPSLPAEMPGGLSLVGVNHAACRFVCDWVVALDPPKYFDGMRVPRIGIVTSNDFIPEYRALFPTARVESVRIVAKPPWLKSVSTSAFAALLVAQQVCHARHIHIYGVDMQEPTDRWNHERPIWSSLVEWLRKQGIAVSEHGAHRTP